MTLVQQAHVPSELLLVWQAKQSHISREHVHGCLQKKNEKKMNKKMFTEEKRK